MISYYSEDIKFNLKNKRLNTKWLKEVIRLEGKELGNLSYIFCSDPYLLDINIKFLEHHYYTDIITFDYCEENLISGDLYISIDTVKINSVDFNVGFDIELDRVMVHGVLHLLGYDDHNDDDIKVMREKENYYIQLKQKMINEI